MTKINTEGIAMTIRFGKLGVGCWFRSSIYGSIQIKTRPMKHDHSIINAVSLYGTYVEHDDDELVFPIASVDIKVGE